MITAGDKWVQLSCNDVGTRRAQRRRNAVPSVVIAGYANVGKSSLLNALTGRRVGRGSLNDPLLRPTP